MAQAEADALVEAQAKAIFNWLAGEIQTGNSSILIGLEELAFGGMRTPPSAGSSPSTMSPPHGVHCAPRQPIAISAHARHDHPHASTTAPEKETARSNAVRRQRSDDQLEHDLPRDVATRPETRAADARAMWMRSFDDSSRDVTPSPPAQPPSPVGWGQPPPAPLPPPPPPAAVVSRGKATPEVASKTRETLDAIFSDMTGSGTISSPLSTEQPPHDGAGEEWTRLVRRKERVCVAIASEKARLTKARRGATRYRKQVRRANRKLTRVQRATAKLAKRKERVTDTFALYWPAMHAAVLEAPPAPSEAPPV